MAISFENPREYIAELIGTAIIMAVGVTVGSLAGINGFSMLTAFAFAITFIGLVYFIGSACNCHFNPLISLSMFINGRMKGNDLLWYILAQFVGGILGCLLAFYLVTQTAHTNVIGYYASLYGIDCLQFNEWNTISNIEVVGAFLIEMICAFILCSVVLKSTDTNKIGMKSGLIIGFTLFALIYIAGAFTFTAVNPAKSLGAAIALLFDKITGSANGIIQLWLFIIAPALGAVIASFVYMILNSEDFDVDAMLANAKAKSAARKEAKAAEKAAAEAEAAEAEGSEEEPVADEEVVEEDLGEVPEIESVEEPVVEAPAETDTVSEEKTE